MSQEMISVGDPVIYSPGFSNDPPILVRVANMTISEEPRDKYGSDVQTAPWSLVLENRVCFGFDNGCWGYSDQIETDILPSTLKKIMKDTKKNLPSHMGKHPTLDAWIADQLKG